jgi:hypothetical protein
MGLPGVNIVVLNGGIGSAVVVGDGVAGMLLSGVAVAGQLELDEPVQLFGLADLEALGIDADYDSANQLDVYYQVSQFYREAGTGAELWIMLMAQTVLMTAMVDVSLSKNGARLLDAAQGRIRLLGVSRVPDLGYVQTITDGLDADVWGAVVNAQQLATQHAANVRPLRVLVAGRGWTGIAGDLADLKQRSENRVAVVLTGQGSGLEDANIGIVLGRLAANPVQRKISRVKSGSLAITEAYLTHGEPIETVENALDLIHDKGYIIYRKFAGKAGYYFNSDHTATSDGDDYRYLSRGRVMDKLMLIAYLTFINEVDEDIDINPDGTLPASYVKSLQTEIEKAVKEQMVANGELSAISCLIDEKQDVISTDKLKVTVSAIPVGYTSSIEIEIGFTNPLNNA